MHVSVRTDFGIRAGMLGRGTQIMYLALVGKHTKPNHCMIKTLKTQSPCN